MGKAWLKIQVGFFALLFLVFMLFLVSGGEDNSSFSGGGGEPFNGTFTDDLPTFPEIKGKGQISDEIAQYAVGTAVKYQLLPSVILSQYAYESMWGQSQSAKNDTNFFGITWFSGSPFPQGSARGIGGSEGGYYMKFPNPKASFNYYGFMVASQSNFNASVGLKNPSESLLILGRGGYAAAGITELALFADKADKSPEATLRFVAGGPTEYELALSGADYYYNGYYLQLRFVPHPLVTNLQRATAEVVASYDPAQTVTATMRIPRSEETQPQPSASADVTEWEVLRNVNRGRL